MPGSNLSVRALDAATSERVVWADIDCEINDDPDYIDDCNYCAYDVEAQFYDAWFGSGYKNSGEKGWYFNWDSHYPPSNATADDVFDPPPPDAVHVKWTPCPGPPGRLFNVIPPVSFSFHPFRFQRVRPETTGCLSPCSRIEAGPPGAAKNPEVVMTPFFPEARRSRPRPECCHPDCCARVACCSS